MTLGVALVGAPSALALSTDLWERSTDWLAAPGTPDLPVAPPLHVAPTLTLPPLVDALAPNDVVASDASVAAVESAR